MRKEIIAKAVEMNAEVLPNIFNDGRYDLLVDEAGNKEFVKWLKMNGQRENNRIIIGEMVVEILEDKPF